MVEIWKDIRGYIGLYEASNWGRIRSLDRWIKCSNGRLRFFKGGILKLSKTKDGYLKVDLWKNGNVKTFLVHCLVWEAFNGPIPEGMQVNHIDENKLNNRLDNLNLMSHKDNINWGTRNKRVSVTLTNGKRSDKVLQLTLDYELINEWPSIAEAGRNGFSKSKICECCNGKRKSYKGFKWVKKINYKMVG